jgi:hypothetical protein
MAIAPHHGGSERTWKFQAKRDDLSVPLGVQRARGAADCVLNEEYTALTEAVTVISSLTDQFAIIGIPNGKPRRNPMSASLTPAFDQSPDHFGFQLSILNTILPQ